MFVSRYVYFLYYCFPTSSEKPEFQLYFRYFKIIFLSSFHWIEIILITCFKLLWLSLRKAIKTFHILQSNLEIGLTTFKCKENYPQYFFCMRDIDNEIRSECFMSLLTIWYMLLLKATYIFIQDSALEH